MATKQSTSAKRFARLVKIAKQVEKYAELLAITLGTFHGTNDFASTGPSLDNGFVLDDIQRTLIGIVVIRSSALLAAAGGSTDATLPTAFNLASDAGVQAQIAKSARQWRPGDPAFATINEKGVRRELGRFLALMPKINGNGLKKHRDWLLAHSTTKKPPDVLYREVWAIADAVLQAVDHLCFFALGRERDLVGISVARREQANDFWKILASNDDNG